MHIEREEEKESARNLNCLVAGVEKCKPGHDGEHLDKQIYTRWGTEDKSLKGMIMDYISHKNQMPV